MTMALQVRLLLQQHAPAVGFSGAQYVGYLAYWCKLHEDGVTSTQPASSEEHVVKSLHSPAQLHLSLHVSYLTV